MHQRCLIYLVMLIFKRLIQAYHYGDPVNATAGSFSGSWTNPALGVLGKLIYLNDTLTALDSAKIGKSLLTAKGGLISATAASTPAMLAVGTNGHVLKANSSTSTGLEWYSLDTTHLNLNPTSQTLTGDLTMSKASPRVAVNATSGHSYITSSGASGSEAGLSAEHILHYFAGVFKRLLQETIYLLLDITMEDQQQERR
jgi:hypothetical protein